MEYQRFDVFNKSDKCIITWIYSGHMHFKICRNSAINKKKIPV